MTGCLSKVCVPVVVCR